MYEVFNTDLCNMKVTASYAEVWRISWPIVLSSLASTVINFTDVAFVARVSETALAASALGGVFYFLMVMVGMGIGVGAQILMSRRAGETKPLLIGQVFNHTLLILLTIGIIMMALLFGLSSDSAGFLVNDKAVADQMMVYLRARACGLPFMMILITFRSFYTGITLTRIITYTTLLMMCLNVGLNYILVFGAWGIPALGLFGAGIASALSEACAAGYALIYAVAHPRFRQFGLFRLNDFRPNVFRSVLHLSSPIVLQNLLSMGAWFLFFVFIEKLGSYELAVSNVVRSVYMVLMTPVWGLSQAANSMVSNLIGQGKKDRVLQLSGKIVTISIIFSCLGILISLIFKSGLFGITTSDQDLINASMNSFYVVCFATVFFSIAFVLLSAVSGTGHTMAAMIIEAVSLSAYMAYLIFFTLVKPASLEVVWFAEVVYWVLLGLLSFFYLRSGKWMNNAPALNAHE